MPVKQPIQSKSVLIVDDDLEALEEMACALRDLGLSVCSATNSVEALLLAKNYRPAFIIMDYALPDTDGLKTISSIQRFLPEATIIMISAVDHFCRFATTKNTGAFAILRKPLNMNSIARFIRDRLEYASRHLTITDLLTN